LLVQVVLNQRNNKELKSVCKYFYNETGSPSIQTKTTQNNSTPKFQRPIERKPDSNCVHCEID
jgi:hypothetical protein